MATCCWLLAAIQDIKQEQHLTSSGFSFVVDWCGEQKGVGLERQTACKLKVLLAETPPTGKVRGFGGNHDQT
jgi:hypothetical protein